MKNIIKTLKIWFIPSEENYYKPRFLNGRFLFFLVVFLFFLKLVALVAISSLPATPFFADVSKLAIIEMTNEQRENLGLSTLAHNSTLDKSAQKKAEDMLKDDYFSHYSPDGESPWYWFHKAEYSYQKAGENLAIGFIDSEEVLKAWMNSLSHKANLLNPDFQQIGIAVLKGDFKGAETTIVVQHFGTPAPATAGSTKETVLPEEKTEEEPAKEENATEEPLEEIAVATTSTSSIEKEFAGIATAAEAFVPATQKLEEKTPYVAFLEFLTVDYPYLIDQIIFYSLILVLFALVLDLFVKRNIRDKKLIFKTLGMAAVLYFFIIFNKQTLIDFIPHQLMI